MRSRYNFWKKVHPVESKIDPMLKGHIIRSFFFLYFLFFFAKIAIKQGLPVVFCCSLRCRIAVYVVVQSWIGFLMYGFISRWKIVCLKENMTTALSKYLQMKSCQVGFSRRINCTIWKRSPCITFSRKKPRKHALNFLHTKI